MLEQAPECIEVCFQVIAKLIELIKNKSVSVVYLIDILFCFHDPHLFQEKSMIKLKNPSGLILFSIFIGWLANMLFYDKRPGISLIIFVAIFSTGFWMLSQLENRPLKKGNLWLLGPLFFCAVMVMIRANEVLIALNILTTIFCFVLLAIFMTTGKAHSLGLLGFGTLPFRAAGNMLLKPWPIVRDNLSVNTESIQLSARDTIYPVLRGVIFAIPVLLVFLGLLVSADAVFAQTILRLFDIDINFGILRFFWTVFVILAFGWAAAGYSAYALRTPASVAKPIPERILEKIRGRLPLGTIESLTILALIDLLFGTFVIIQFAYLFGGNQFIDLGDTSYAEYARRGFFELVAVAVLTLLLIQVMNWFTVKKHARDKLLFNLFSSLIIGFVIVMLISAFQRLALYEWTYGFTQLRIFVHTFVVWMGVALVWYVITLWRRPDRFAIGALLCLFGFVVTLNLLNPDAMIVRKNLQRYQTIGHLDLEYLTKLSADAVPDLILLAAEIETDFTLDNGIDNGIDNGNECSGHDWARVSSGSENSVDYSTRSTCIETSHPDLLTDNLISRANEYKHDPSWAAWQSFHIAHSRAALQLAN
ncbi:MAG: hypothetical protein ACI85U_003583 [Candidatus Promineifilaceae bacterium]